TNAVEHSLDPRQAAIVNVKSGQSKYHQKRRQDKCHADSCGPNNASVEPPEVHCQLCSERSGRELGESQSLQVILLRDPMALFDQVPLHMAGKRDRAAKAKGTEFQEYTIRTAIVKSARVSNLVTAVLLCSCDEG